VQNIGIELRNPIGAEKNGKRAVGKDLRRNRRDRRTNSNTDLGLSQQFSLANTSDKPRGRKGRDLEPVGVSRALGNGRLGAARVDMEEFLLAFECASHSRNAGLRGYQGTGYIQAYEATGETRDARMAGRTGRGPGRGSLRQKYRRRFEGRTK
jgi:hypothetical protein